VDRIEQILFGFVLLIPTLIILIAVVVYLIFSALYVKIVKKWLERSFKNNGID
jgi:type II secretory pathway component PulF